jgi:heavy metal translocating P-type ATPase
MIKQVRRFFGDYKALGLVILAMVIGLVLDLTGYHTAAHWILGTAALVGVVPLLWEMIQTIRTGGYGIDILAATAIVTAVILHEYWAAIVIVLMLTGGRALEDYAEQRAKSDLSSLLAHKPQLAHLVKGRRTVDVPVREITVNDKLIILPGEVVPVDAVILEGDTSLDESSLTGESLPVDKTVGDDILSGSVNLEGALTVRALRPEAESQYEQIIKLVRAAASTQSPFVRLADRYSIPFTLISFVVAGAAWLVSGEAVRFLEVLVVATPCPLLLGAPIALISGMGRAAKRGVIVKTGSALEQLAAAETIAFDKTGTLTKGEPVVDRVETFNKFTKHEVLAHAAALEQNSNHILAQAIVEAAAKQNVKVPKVKQVKELSGRGLAGRIGGKDVLVGRLKFINEAGIPLPKTLPEQAMTATYVAINGELAGLIRFTDEIRPEAKTVLRALQKLKIKHVAMVTGDNEATAVAIAKELNITDVYPDCLPADKLVAVEQMPDRPVAFVGDGVNDAPVLTAADVGIALGARGATAASDSADIVILHNDLTRVTDSIKIAKYTFFIAKQSILIGIFISIGLMAVFATGKFKPVQGALLQEVVDVAVIFNALRAHGPWSTPKLLTKPVERRNRQKREKKVVKSVDAKVLGKSQKNS